MSAGEIRAGRAYVELGVNDKIAAGLRAAEKRLKAFGEGVRHIGMGMSAMGAAVVAPLLGMAKIFADTGHDLTLMSARTGVSVEALSALGFAAEQSGTDLESLETGIRKMQKGLTAAASGSQEAQTALGVLGLTIADIQRLNPEQQFKLIADRMSKIKDPTTRAAMAVAFFGRSGTQLLPMMEEGAKGIAELEERARKLGLVMSTDAAKSGEVLADTVEALGSVSKRTGTLIGEALAPILTDIANRAIAVVVSVNDWIRQNQEMVVSALKVGAAVVGIGVGLVAVGTVISGVGTVFGVLASTVAGVGTALAAVTAVVAAVVSPIGLVISAAVALGVALVSVSDVGAEALSWLGTQFKTLRDSVYRVVGGIVDALAAGDIPAAANIMWLALKVAWQQGAATLDDIWTSVKNGFINTAHAMYYGAWMIAEDFCNWLTVGWIETTSFLSKTWINFTRDLADAWKLVGDWITRRWLDIMELFGEITAEQASQAGDILTDTLGAEIAKVENDREAALKKAEANRNKRLAAEERGHELVSAEIGRRDVEGERQNKADQAAAALAKSKGDLEKARAELDAALAAAKEHRGALGDAAVPIRGKRPGMPGELEDQIGQLGKLKFSTVGTFNPAALREFGASDTARRIANATEGTEKHLRRLVSGPVPGWGRFA